MYSINSACTYAQYGSSLCACPVIDVWFMCAPANTWRSSSVRYNVTDEDLRSRNVYILSVFHCYVIAQQFAQSYLCHSNEPLPNYSKCWWTDLCLMLLLMLALGVGLLGGVKHLPFPSPPFPSHHPSREAVPLLPFFFTTSSWLPSAGCSARVLSCTIYWWRSLEPMTRSGSTSTLLWDGVSLTFPPLNLQYVFVWA